MHPLTRSDGRARQASSSTARRRPRPLVPWYLSSSLMQLSDEGPSGDIEHTCDVGGMVVRAARAERQRGDDATSLGETAAELLRSCEYNLDSWHWPDGPASGQSEWRLSPSRKFNWWFGTTSDLGCLLASVDRAWSLC